MKVIKKLLPAIGVTTLAIVVAVPWASAGGLSKHVPALTPPKVKGGLKRCYSPMMPYAPLPRSPGERIVYSLELLGFQVGTVHFETTRRGTFDGEPVTEYRGWIQPEDLVTALVRIEGRVASIVPDSSFTPIRSMTHYRFRKDRVHETQSRAGHGTQVYSHGEINGRRSKKTQAYSTPTHDFVSGFLLLRRIPEHANGCAVIYSHQRVYTAWIEPEGAEALDTPQGKIQMQRYKLRYGSDRTKKIRAIRVWFWPGPERIPYQIQGLTEYTPVARLHSYRRGQ